MKPKLQYFGVPGRGEAVRLMLKLRGDSYSDVYINTKSMKVRNKEEDEVECYSSNHARKWPKCWYVKGHIKISRKDNNR